MGSSTVPRARTAVEEIAKPSIQKQVDPDIVRHRSTKGGVYIPHARIQKLPFVQEQVGNNKILECKQCKRRITSCWFFSPPSKQACVLIPRNGHIACRGSGSKAIAHYASVDG